MTDESMRIARSPRLRGAARFRLRLRPAISDQAGQDHHAVPGRRRDRHRRAADRAEAVGAARPAVLHREHRRRRRQSRHGQRRARRRATATPSCSRRRASWSIRASTTRSPSTSTRTSSRSPRPARTPNSWHGQSGFPGEDDEGADRPDQEASPASTASPRPAPAPRRRCRSRCSSIALGLDFVTVPFAGGGPMIAVAARRPHADRLQRHRQLRWP